MSSLVKDSTVKAYGHPLLQFHFTLPDLNIERKFYHKRLSVILAYYSCKIINFYLKKVPRVYSCPQNITNLENPQCVFTAIHFSITQSDFCRLQYQILFSCKINFTDLYFLSCTYKAVTESYRSTYASS